MFVVRGEAEILESLDSVLKPNTTLVILDLIPSNAPFVPRLQPSSPHGRPVAQTGSFGVFQPRFRYFSQKNTQFQQFSVP